METMTKQKMGNLVEALANLGARPIADIEFFFGERGGLSNADRLLIIDQALLLLEQLYPHLAMKCFRHAIDPLQSLRLLRVHAVSISERNFHRELMGIFRCLRDIHTSYTPPPPYAHLSAFLPFVMEACRDSSGNIRYIVTRLINGFKHSTFREGVEIVYWHGAKVERAVARHAADEVGANADACRALGNLFMTVRWLGANPLPSEEWVILGYRKNLKQQGEQLMEIRLPWSLIDLKNDQLQWAVQSLWLFEHSLTNDGLDRALDVRNHTEHLTRRALFTSAITLGRKQNRGGALNKQNLPDLSSRLPQLFAAEYINDPGSGLTYGYIRLRTFVHANSKDFRDEFRRLLALMPRSGLVLDLRSNPGGFVQCAESLLQLLTPRSITPLPFRFISSDLTSRFSEALPANLVNSGQSPRGAFFKRLELHSRWGESIRVARSTGAPFSSGVPLTSVEEANNIGQEYFAPVVLIIDAITYSAGDIFAAGFADHEIGPVLGVCSTQGANEDNTSDGLMLIESTDGQNKIGTGGGGASVWQHADIVQYLPDYPDIRPLPSGCSIRLAACFCERTGKFSGMPIEELGVLATVTHNLTEHDIREDNQDLKIAAMALIANSPKIWLDVDCLAAPGSAFLRIKPTGLDRVDVYLDKRPLCSRDTLDREVLDLPLPNSEASKFSSVEVQGFKGDKLVACRRFPFPSHSD